MGTKTGPWDQGAALREIIGEGIGPMQAAAAKLGVAYQTVYRWVGATKIPQRAIRDVTDALGCNEQWLATGKGSKYPNASTATAGAKVAERLLIVYNAEVARLSARLAKDLAAALR
jgi:hypothetical protein